MKCKICKKEAEIKILAPYCKECFLNQYKKKVERVIKKFSLIEKGEKILVCVSGGKDSLSLADVLKKLNYDISILHIDVHIGKCRNIKTKEIVEKFAKERNIPFFVTTFEEFFDIPNLEKFFKVAKRPICATCGLLKRQLFNRFARENKFEKIATAHCADDIAKYFFKIILSPSNEAIDWFSKLNPYTPSTHPKLLPRIRPLIECLEIENLAYTKFSKIEVAYCAMCSFFMRNDKITNVLRVIDEKIPDFKFKLIKTLEKIKIESKKEVKKEEIKECKICGEPTNQEICAICKIKKKMNTS